MTLLSDILVEMNLPALDCEITGLALDSREIKPGHLFFAYKGSQFDGRQFIDDAILKGATVILAESDEADVQWRKSVPIYPIKNLNHQIAKFAARFFDYPAKKIRIAGITGTNGKTSCSHFIAAILHQHHFLCGVIGTLGKGIYGNIQAGNLTTPDAITLQKIFSEFVSEKAKFAAMEVSSHSLDQGRVNDIPFEVGIFTNLTRDHLDYHGTMEAYGAAKKKLFSNALLKQAVINADDEFGKKIIVDLHAQKKIFAYSVKREMTLPNTVSLIHADDVRMDSAGIHARVHSPWGEGNLSVPLLGQFNLSNILAVITTLCLFDIPLEKVLTSLTSLTSVPGRMQRFGGKNKPLVIVDYAHTPDALEKVLSALREHVQGKLFCVFGCGGDRDRGKRPMMAKIAEQYSDVIIVTDDNPRHEDPKKITTEILTGFSREKKIILEHDRAKAIHHAISSAFLGDCVLIAGKGAETYQQMGDEKIPFSDAEKVLEFFSN